METSMTLQDFLLTAHHEAGHALLYMQTGMTPEYIAIDRKDYREGSVRGQTRVTLPGMGAAAFAEGDEVWKNWLRRAIQEVAEKLAGPVAEVRFARREFSAGLWAEPYSKGDEYLVHDISRAYDLLTELYGIEYGESLEYDSDMHMSRIESFIVQSLEANWGVVTAIVDLLVVSEGEISHKELSSLSVAPQAIPDVLLDFPELV